MHKEGSLLLMSNVCPCQKKLEGSDTQASDGQHVLLILSPVVLASVLRTPCQVCYSAHSALPRASLSS
jgi:hypothetical protein